MNKKNLGNLFKIIGVTIGGALVANTDVQQAVQQAVPGQWGMLVGVGFGIASLFLKPPKSVPQQPGEVAPPK
jgi:hypothetical protein